MAKKTVLITGGAGFLGSHLCDRFIARGFKVIAVDNLITGAQRNIVHLSRHKDFKFIRHDISRPLKVAGGVDYVLHFASPASPVDYGNHPIATLQAGAQGTQNALDMARAKKATFLLASTSEVYGDPLVHPQKENYWGNVNPTGPRSVYDEAKRFAEALTFAYHRVHRVNVKIARIFNTYGPRMQIKDGRVVPNFIDQILHKRPLTVYGNGRQTRSFCYVDDLVDGITKLLFSKLRGPVNVGSPREFTILEFARLVKKTYDPHARIVFMPLPKDDPKQRRPDITLARRTLGWQPKVPLEKGIQMTMDWFTRHYDH
ncbi:MAG: SDR family oxidoreductase [Candidatus Omnitrophica bacterium]|nr:SDR family oxidoreductase [Candidatus Omnitrophota bacterium]